MFLTTMLAGVLDAFALLTYKVFVGIQTGNLLFVAMGLAGQLKYWPTALASLIAFGVGGLIGATIRRVAAAKRPPPPVLELAAMMLVLIIWAVVNGLLDSGGAEQTHRALLAALGGLATGILGWLFVNTFGIPTTTSYQTGTVLRVITGLADWLLGWGDDRSRARRVTGYGLLSLIGYGLGGVVGASAHTRPEAMFVIAGVLVILLLALARTSPPG
ncbi:DUF1275 family protein [Sphaerisporangium viridialbum]|uniref:DUF1275 family protein n=1 Tax=Sphaerisporangium viridialbum TaxID=46189 RepID=UPI003C767C77